MTNQNWIILLGLLAVAAVVILVSQPPVPAPPLTHPFTVISEGSFGPFASEGYYSFSNQEDWSSFLKFLESTNRSIPLSSAVDFSKEDVVVVAMGEQRSGGYSIKVKEILLPKPFICPAGAQCDVARAVWTVVVETKSPAPGEAVIAAITTPYQIIKVPRQNGLLSYDYSFVVDGKNIPESIYPWILMAVGPGE